MQDFNILLLEDNHFHPRNVEWITALSIKLNSIELKSKSLEIIDLNKFKIIRDPKQIKLLLQKNKIKPFVFLNNCN